MAILPYPTAGLILLAVLLTGCLDTRQRTPAEAAAHPLLNQLWSTEAQGFISMDELLSALADADYVLLGENHDNPVHHQLQAQIIASLPWPKPAVAGFEQIHSGQATALDAWLQSAAEGTSGLEKALAWEQSGWPEWALYQPVFAAVLARGWRPVDLMFASATVRDVFSDGVGAALPTDVIDQLQPDTLFSPEQRLAMQVSMGDAHCGHMPSEHMPAMVEVQIARDAHMAWRLATAAERAVVITGNGHARRDWGVPLFLQRLRPEANVVSITLTEVAASGVAPSAYVTAHASWSDFTLFTPAHDRGNPCAGIRG